MLDGVEFYVSECETILSPAATPFSKPAEPILSCTVLVSFARSCADRAALRPLLTALSFGQTITGVCSGSEWTKKLPNRLSERLKSASHDFVTAVIFSGSDGDSGAETVQAAADVLRQHFGTSLTALLAVSHKLSSHQFARVQGVSGFVVGASGTNSETARSVFLCLAMLSAPRTLNGIDLVDLQPVLGTAMEPTVVADAMWLRDGEGRLVFATAADAQAVRCAAKVAAFPLVDGPSSWTELHRVCKAVRGEANDSASMIYFAADKAIAPNLLTSRLSVVHILCAASP